VLQFETNDILVKKRVGSLSLLLETSDGLQDSVKSEEFDDEVSATVRVYMGEILRGPFKGLEIILKEYPYVPGVSFDELAKNEVRAHARIRALEEEEGKNLNVCSLLGTYAGRLGETWLVFESSCIYPVSYWTEVARGNNPAAGKKQQVWSLLTLIDPDIEWHRRQAFVFTIVRETLKGLAAMHRANVLHCNLGPDSVVLSTVDEKQVGGVRNLKVKLRELSLAVSVSDESLRGGGTLAEIWEAGLNQQPNLRKDHEEDLWRRAEKSGCSSYFQKKNFGVAEDIHAMGLLILHVIFNTYDMPSLKRLVSLNVGDSIQGFRDYMEADPQLSNAVAWLDHDEGDGWGLIEAMLASDWKKRPTADSCLQHPFMKQTLKY
jgi:hypothetical protein